MSDLEAFREETRAWLEANCPEEMRQPVRDEDDVCWGGRNFQFKNDAQKAWLDTCIEKGYTVPAWPKEYGGAGLNPGEAKVLREEMRRINARPPLSSFGIWMLGPALLHFGTEGQKQRFLNEIARGEIRWCQGYSEPGSGSDLAGLQAKGEDRGDHFIANGQKVWTSRAEYSDLMLLLARTTPLDQCAKKTDGLSVFLVDMRAVRGKSLTITPIRTMMNHSTTQLFFDDMRIPASSLVGEEGKGFRYILSGMNAERILIAAECIGDAKWFIESAARYSTERSVFGRPIGQNQGIQFPIARAYSQMRAAELMLHESIRLYEAGENPGEEANLAKLLCADASWAAAEMCVQTYGGFGFAEEYDVERKFREARLYQVAPISTNLILSYIAEHVLKLPRSY